MLIRRSLEVLSWRCIGMLLGDSACFLPAAFCEWVREVEKQREWVREKKSHICGVKWETGNNNGNNNFYRDDVWSQSMISQHQINSPDFFSLSPPSPFYLAHIHSFCVRHSTQWETLINSSRLECCKGINEKFRIHLQKLHKSNTYMRRKN